MQGLGLAERPIRQKESLERGMVLGCLGLEWAAPALAMTRSSSRGAAGT